MPYLKSSPRQWRHWRGPPKCKAWKITNSFRTYSKKKPKKTKTWRRKAAPPMCCSSCQKTRKQTSQPCSTAPMPVTQELWWAVLAKLPHFHLITSQRIQLRGQGSNGQAASWMVRVVSMEIWTCQERLVTWHTRKTREFRQRISKSLRSRMYAPFQWMQRSTLWWWGATVSGNSTLTNKWLTTFICRCSVKCALIRFVIIGLTLVWVPTWRGPWAKAATTCQ